MFRDTGGLVQYKQTALEVIRKRVDLFGKVAYIIVGVEGPGKLVYLLGKLFDMEL